MTFKYPLLENAFSNNDMKEAIKVIKSTRITMAKKTKEFEKKFSNFIKSKYCLMVNSGSSANLLAFFALINPLKKGNLIKVMNVLFQLCVGLHHYGQYTKQE